MLYVLREASRPNSSQHPRHDALKRGTLRYLSLTYSAFRHNFKCTMLKAQKRNFLSATMFLSLIQPDYL